MLRRFNVSTVLSAVVLTAAAAEEPPPTTSARPTAKELTFFESKIRPVLVNHCYDCHSDESGAAEGGLRLDDRDSLRAGGKRGPAIVPGRPDASLMLKAIAHAHSELKMPPKQPRLSANVLADVRTWIKMGAPDPRTVKQRDGDAAWSAGDDNQTLWSLTPPRSSPAPNVADSSWPRDDVDRFVLRRLRENKLQPSSDAPPNVILRRVYFDLIGLCPSPEDLRRFLDDCDDRGLDAALTSVVDRLLDSPRYGEHWGRHWLDVARFAESSGKQANIPFPYAWRYRDYVIDSINDDVPIDRFLTEQIAGDLLPFESKRQRARLLVATGFLAVGTKNLSESNDRQFHADLVDEQIDTLTRALIGQSVACARCHDHKFDPFTMQDYYALAGIFRSTKTFFGTFVSPASQQGGELINLPRLKDEVILHESIPAKRLQKMRKQLADLKAEWAEMEAAKRALFAGKKPEKTFTLRQVLANIWRTGPIVGRLQLVDDDGNAIPVAMGVLDREEIVDAPLLSRGDVKKPGKPVPRAFPQAVAVAGSPTIPADQSGRKELAAWLTDDRHPLTSRVFVNRVWHYLFGNGLVRTVDNFGATGERPSHPQLLDTLAVQFAEDGWSLKRLVRRLVLTRAYRQASDYDESSFLKDPDNRLLWRTPKRRLPAEAIRDAMLCVSGELDVSRPQGSLVARQIKDKPISLIGLDKKLPRDLDGSAHRSVYLPVIRDRLPDVLEFFDFAEPSLVTGDRAITNVPVQALYLMNSSFVQSRSRAFASRLAKETKDVDSLITRSFLLCFAREPDEEERRRARVFLGETVTPGEPARISPQSELLRSYCQALLSTAEFRNLD